MAIFYRSLRVGRHGQTFFLYKFRTMREDGGSPTASLNDFRLTPLGRFLRKTKLDELPTFWNLLKGEITVVGPRPDVPSEIDSLDKGIREIVLSVKPGLISPATLWDINEDELLKDEVDAHKAYCEKIKPTKYRLNCWYVRNKTFLLDIKVIVATILKLMKLPVPFKVYPKHLTQ